MIRKTVAWIGGCILAFVSIYLFGKRDGKNAQQKETLQKTAKLVKEKNRLASSIKSKSADKLRYRD